MKYTSTLIGMFVAALLTSNVLNTKIFSFLGVSFPVGIITFPVTFVIADALTEVYGFKAARQAIWVGFGSLLLFVFATQIAILLPPAGFWTQQAAFDATLRQVPRLVVASIIAYVAGEFVNSYVVSKRKVATNGRGMASRFVLSTFAGQAVDTLIFMTIAFIGVFPLSEMGKLFLTAWAFKVIWEIACLPLSMSFVNMLKRAEGIDVFDRDESYSVFKESK